MTATDKFKSAVLGNPPQVNKKPDRELSVEAFGDLETAMISADADLQTDIDATETLLRNEFTTADAGLQSQINNIGVTYNGAYETRAQLYADLTPDANELWRVFGDATTAYRGVYKKVGASGTGSWLYVGPLPGGDTSGLQSQVDALTTTVGGKLTNSIGTKKLFGRNATGTGVAEQIAVGGGLVIDDALAQLRLAPAVEATIKGTPVGGGTQTPIDLTVSQVQTMLGIGELTYGLSTDKPNDYIDKFGFYVDKGIEVETDGTERHFALGLTRYPATENDPFTITDKFGFLYDPATGETPDIPSNIENLFSDAVYDAAESVAQTEVNRLNTFSVSFLASTATGAILRAKTGQSFRAASDNARLFASLPNLTTNLKWQYRAYSVGPDSRCVNTGPVYVTFGGNSRTLTKLVEHFIAPTGTDSIYSDADAASGNYPDNARGGVPEVIEEYVYQWLKRTWELKDKDVAETAFYTVAMNHAKTDGLADEVFLGDGLLRFQSMCDVFYDAVSALNGAAPSTVGVGNTDPMLCDNVSIDHGQADEAAATADYTLRVNNFGVAAQSKFNAKWGQVDPASYTMTQVGGPRYGTAEMLCAQQQGDMMLDITTASKNKFLVGVSWEGPSFYDVGGSPAHPNAGDGHLTQAGNLLLGLRHAIGMYFLHVKKEHYWLPFPMPGYFDGKKFIIPIPNKFPPLQVSKMPYGVTMMLLNSLGVSFEAADGTDNPVKYARIVPGRNYCLEGECEFNINAATIGKTGKRLLANKQYGFVNIRDSFDIKTDIELTFNKNQTVYAGQFADVPQTNGKARYLEDIHEFIGKPPLGNPCIRRSFSMQSITALGV